MEEIFDCCDSDDLHLLFCLLSFSVAAGPPVQLPVGPFLAAGQPALAPFYPELAGAFGLQAPWHDVHPAVEPALTAFLLIGFDVPLLPRK